MAATKTPRRRGKKTSDGPRFDVYQAVTDKIVAALETGVVPWRKPWKNLGEGMQRNVTSKRPYRGVNQLLLGLSQFDSPWWITFKAAAELDARVKPEHAKKNGGVGPELVVYWNRIKCRACTDGDGHVTVASCDRCGNRRSFMLLRFFTVWNVEQIDGLPDGADSGHADGRRAAAAGRPDRSAARILAGRGRTNAVARRRPRLLPTGDRLGAASQVRRVQLSRPLLHDPVP
jgi:antirestriction protein ArdC